MRTKLNCARKKFAGVKTRLERKNLGDKLLLVYGDILPSARSLAPVQLSGILFLPYLILQQKTHFKHDHYKLLHETWRHELKSKLGL